MVYNSTGRMRPLSYGKYNLLFIQIDECMF
jgi:hypothetical protein